jgi:hypothetical protein
MIDVPKGGKIHSRRGSGSSVTDVHCGEILMPLRGSTGPIAASRSRLLAQMQEGDARKTRR